MEYNDLYKRVEIHVTGLFNTGDSSNLIYHNIEHTRKVFSHVCEIAGHYNLIETDKLIVYVAAWFHDTGYLFAEPEAHEAKSAELMKDFIKNENLDEGITTGIEQCILATKWPVHPQNLLQQILVDADTYNLGTKEFVISNEQVYKEYIAKQGYVNRQEWSARAIKFLEKHQYYTQYCKEKLQDRKKKNIKNLKQELKGMSEMVIPVTKDAGPGKVQEKTNINLTTKGIQTMLRLTSENHLKLSDMADGKANILISVNAIIISVILSVLLRKLQGEPYLTIPTILFLASSVCTIVIAILATRPKVTGGTFSDQDIAERKTNLLFFGNFYKMPYEAYEKSMTGMMKDTEYLYNSLIRDIYLLGVVLARKYRLIRWAYNVFMIGIILSVIAFGIAAILNSSAYAAAANTPGAPL